MYIIKIHLKKKKKHTSACNYCAIVPIDLNRLSLVTLNELKDST